MKLKRNRDGTLKNIITMGDLIEKDRAVQKDDEREKRIKALKDKYNKSTNK